MLHSILQYSTLCYTVHYSTVHYVTQYCESVEAMKLYLNWASVLKLLLSIH